ncbi:MAG: hypothetical protein IPP17_19825 [Bacteroidetes bacterium]|nr:hypothetical protein [Bacteroidota bacterium]
MADTDFFKYGAKWLRADFHLHTQADKEFKYSGELGAFFPEYIQRLKDEAINLGVITNHNKFDLEEFKTLKKQASKEGIWLLPGVELSVNDGGNGIHCLIVFDYDSWYQNNTNYIDQFLVAAFEGIPNRENENTRCKYSLKDVLEKLQEHRNSKRNSFIVMA